MSDPTQGFGFSGGGGDGIDLSMGLDTTGGLGDFTPVPEGTHRFRVTEPPEVNFTRDGENMLVCKFKIVASQVDGAIGRVHTERIVIPGPERRANDFEKWQMMMRILRQKLEAMTGKPWRDDNLKLRPSELGGCEFVATVKHEERTYTKDGEERHTTDANLSNWQAINSGVGDAPSGTVSGAEMAAQIAAQQTSSSDSPPTGFRL